MRKVIWWMAAVALLVPVCGVALVYLVLWALSEGMKFSLLGLFGLGDRFEAWVFDGEER